MSAIEVIISLLLVLLLISYLIIKHRQRERIRPVPPGDPATWTGRGIDTSRLTPRIAQIRRDYLAAPRTQPHARWLRQRLQASVGRAVSRLSFFQRRKSEEEDGHRDVS